jgi:hypothetical protein
VDLGVPAAAGAADALLQLGAEARLARVGDGVQDGGGEAAVQAAAVDGGGDVEAGADLALGAAVGGLGEVVQDGAAGCGGQVEVGGVQVVG